MQIRYHNEAKTQKARGILALQGIMEVPLHVALALPITQEDFRTIRSCYKYHMGKLFARPCPVTPRHGFVDSREIDLNNLEEQLIALQKETLEADPNAELIIMPKIKGKASAVMTPKAVSIGKGTDGATQGKDAITLPLMHVKIPKNLVKDAGVKDTPYIESVLEAEEWGYDRVWTVQVRDGLAPPETMVGDKWVPSSMTVKGVLTTEGTALEFEARAKAAEEGTVLWHPGGNLLSHFSQHAMLRNMPISFSLIEPKIGDVWDKTADKTKEPLVNEFLSGLSNGYSIDLTDFQKHANWLYYCLVMTHNAPVLMSDPLGAWALGQSIAMLLRFAFAACLGEYRHKQRTSIERGDVYVRVLKNFDVFWNKRALVQKACNSFNNDFWRSGFGGKKWGECAEASLGLERAIALFVRQPSEERLKDCIGASHNVINAGHNNGPFLSKFVGEGAFDSVSHGYAPSMLKGYYVAWDMLTSNDREDGTDKPILKKVRSIRTVTKLTKGIAKKAEEKKAKKLTIKAKPLKVLLVNKRLEMYHFQFGVSGKYKSCTIPAEVLGTIAKAWLDKVIETNTQYDSMAGSPTKYALVAKEGQWIPSSLWSKLSANSIVVY